MNTETLARTTFVLDRSTNEDLAYLSSRMGRSRSSLVREILSPAISDLAALIRQVPETPTPADLDSFRRAGLDLMGAAYSSGLQVLEVSRG